MHKDDKRLWLIGGALALAGFLACEWLRSAAERRRRIARGELVPLAAEWRRVRGLRMHACVARRDARAGALPVVLVHGLGVSSAYFVPTAERLAPHFDVHAPDLPGHGLSDAPVAACGIAEHADYLAAWMDAAGIVRAALVANSMGCQIAVEAALRHPHRVERLVLIGPTLERGGRNPARLLVRFVHAGAYERPRLTFVVARDYLRMAPRLWHELRSMRAYPIEEAIARIRIPVLFVRGENDAIAPRAWMLRMAHSARGQLIEIPGAGHAVNYSAADALVERIVPFLQGRAGGTFNSA